MAVDLVVVGAGLVGLATARAALAARPDLRVVVVEKEDVVACHQTGRNSGVLHAGLYYRPGSRKAALCQAGKARMEAFCDEEGIPWTRSGKVVVAVTDDEVPRLDALAERAVANGVATERLDADGLREREPHAAGVAALWVPSTGVTDFSAVARRMAERLEEAGAEIRTGTAVMSGRETSTGVVVETDGGAIEARALVTCAGLWADRVAKLFGATPSVELVPFRGEYALLKPDAAKLVRGLIYPVPDPALPFLGVHLTRRVDGTVDAGPSAALAFARDGYRFSTVRPRDLGEALASPAFRRLARRHVRSGLDELARSLSLTTFWKAARRLLPQLRRQDLERAPAGVRAQALHPDGTLADDFVIEETARAVHVINAPSPAATASLAVGDEVAGRALQRL
ncbi:L-2-hydroxyglutarate oxidase [Rubrivirga marina]|uniref:Hydroxyglutarate oxidase n=1 Tax=Rubrivirga marina TaxID=1196024 RepID=A0A271J0G2_9BACT|nr:L-2-hydroxyglutarate oxidase [Rubrivirga marina]PAP76728.1 hydroxyglutarate oxidase [Rubrivirga marina]